MVKLILMRHGESIWNKKNIFTGWVDVALSLKGIDEAIRGGQRIRDIPIDIIFTSTLVRAEMTAMLVMAQHYSEKTPRILHTGEGKLDDWGAIYNEATTEDTIPIIRAWQLNERMYGKLQGLNKMETMDKFGPEQVHIWRRSFDIAPPEGESLKMTAARTIPYFENMIIPHLRAGKNVFVSAHGNSLRSIIMDLDQLSPQQVINLEIPTGEPMLYDYNNDIFTKVEL